MTPATPDDWDLVCAHAGLVEEGMLSQICVLSRDLTFPLWAGDSAMVTLKVTSCETFDAFPALPCVRIGRSTEIHVKPNTAECPSAAADSAEEELRSCHPAVLRVQDYDGKSHGTVYACRNTLKKLEDAAKWHDCSFAWLAARGSTTRGVIVAVCENSNAATDHIMVSHALRRAAGGIECLDFAVMRPALLRPMRWPTSQDDADPILFRAHATSACAADAEAILKELGLLFRSSSSSPFPVSSGSALELSLEGGRRTAAVSIESVSRAEPMRENAFYVVGHAKQSPQAVDVTVSHDVVVPSDLDATSQGASLGDLGGVDSVLKDIIDAMADHTRAHDASRRVERAGSLRIRGVYLHGSRGSGKTSVMQAAARKMRRDPGSLVHTVWIDCLKLRGSKRSEVRERLESAFSEAYDRAPSIVVMDDIDLLVPASEKSASKEMTTRLLGSQSGFAILYLATALQ